MKWGKTKKKDDRQDTADHLQPATKERKTTMGPSADQSTSPGSLTLSRQACLHRHVASNRTELSLLPRRRSHAMISSGIATNRVRF